MNLAPVHAQAPRFALARLMSLNASSVLMPLLFGTAGAVVGVSLVFWSVGLAVGAGARSAWLLRPAASDGGDHPVENGKYPQ